METRLVRDQKMVKEGIKALVSHMQISKVQALMIQFLAFDPKSILIMLFLKNLS